jgi:hypothetical protein
MLLFPIPLFNYGLYSGTFRLFLIVWRVTLCTHTNTGICVLMGRLFFFGLGVKGWKRVGD